VVNAAGLDSDTLAQIGQAIASRKLLDDPTSHHPSASARDLDWANRQPAEARGGQQPLGESEMSAFGPDTWELARTRDRILSQNREMQWKLSQTRTRILANQQDTRWKLAQMRDRLMRNNQDAMTKLSLMRERQALSQKYYPGWVNDQTHKLRQHTQDWATKELGGLRDGRLQEAATESIGHIFPRISNHVGVVSSLHSSAVQSLGTYSNIRPVYSMSGQLMSRHHYQMPSGTYHYQVQTHGGITRITPH